MRVTSFASTAAPEEGTMIKLRESNQAVANLVEPCVETRTLEPPPPLRIEITQEEILADLIYPASLASEDRAG
jgi:hypothetical protein